ncbi:hypothetical protein J7E73_00645 [Paenibacillus albidus]|uniref:hypothetical protein n=1 Tax=Paenibacillus albidus TaxID=2041023 RepID=UPI001BE9D543|nr:hypothetical protein [Paenibacillus albidus]MBT2287659.1 hypothetical protein [Paenibacillus albidus]
MERNIDQETSLIALMVNEFGLAFFDRYVKGAPSVPLDLVAGKYPEAGFRAH